MKEKISPRLMGGVLFITFSCALLSFQNQDSLELSFGSIFVLLAGACWGLENNCTRRLSDKDPMDIVMLKGIFSGIGSVVIGLLLKERIGALWSVFAVMAVGFVSYGCSIFFYVYAQRLLGAARTSAYYAVSPFIGTFLSLLIFREMPPLTYFFALVLMIIGAFLCAEDKPLTRRKRPREIR